MTAPSWFLPSLDAKDRKLLLWAVSAALLLAVVTGIENGGQPR